MRIMYIHGFGSEFNPDHPKIKDLKKHLPKYLVAEDQPVEVVGISIDYSTEDPIYKVMNSDEFNHIDLIVGTSMGGWTASHVGLATGIPWVAINPALEPEKTLERYVIKPGKPIETDFAERPILLTDLHLRNTYKSKLNPAGGLILLDRGDELFNANDTAAYTTPRMTTIMFNGGSHRFEHMKEAVPYIAEYWNMSVCHGID